MKKVSNIEDLKKKRIAVLMGGSSHEREISLRSGKKVLESLKRQGFSAIGLDTDEDLIDRLREVDIVFIALHGRFGEDGCIQGMLEMIRLPYTGSGVLASALAMNKVASKRIFESLKIPTPRFRKIEKDEDIERQCQGIIEELGLPLIAKPTSEGSSLGVKIIKDKEELEPSIREIINEYKDAFVEEFITGTHVTVGILNSLTLPILELVPKGEFYDYKAKYTSGMTEFIIPARLTPHVYKETQRIALSSHKALGCYGFSRVDIIVSHDGIPYVHDVNTIPGLTELSDLPAQAKAAGIDYDELILRMLKTAIDKGYE